MRSTLLLIAFVCVATTARAACDTNGCGNSCGNGCSRVNCGSCQKASACCNACCGGSGGGIVERSSCECPVMDCNTCQGSNSCCQRCCETDAAPASCCSMGSSFRVKECCAERKSAESCCSSPATTCCGAGTEKQVRECCDQNIVVNNQGCCDRSSTVLAPNIVLPNITIFINQTPIVIHNRPVIQVDHRCGNVSVVQGGSTGLQCSSGGSMCCRIRRPPYCLPAPQQPYIRCMPPSSQVTCGMQCLRAAPPTPPPCRPSAPYGQCATPCVGSCAYGTYQQGCVQTPTWPYVTCPTTSYSTAPVSYVQSYSAPAAYVASYSSPCAQGSNCAYGGSYAAGYPESYAAAYGTSYPSYGAGYSSYPGSYPAPYGGYPYAYYQQQTPAAQPSEQLESGQDRLGDAEPDSINPVRVSARADIKSATTGSATSAAPAVPAPAAGRSQQPAKKPAKP